jgi:hypothetical protein
MGERQGTVPGRLDLVVLLPGTLAPEKTSAPTSRTGGESTGDAPALQKGGTHPASSKRLVPSPDQFISGIAYHPPSSETYSNGLSLMTNSV